MYVSEEVALTLPEVIEIAGCQGRIFKPAAMMKCCLCQETGHKAADMKCPARAPDGFQGNLEIVHGGKNLLSNLHNCEDSCLIKDGQHDFSSSEQHYQFNHL